MIRGVLLPHLPLIYEECLCLRIDRLSESFCSHCLWRLTLVGRRSIVQRALLLTKKEQKASNSSSVLSLPLADRVSRRLRQ